jgi:hypothetical protein
VNIIIHIVTENQYLIQSVRCYGVYLTMICMLVARFENELGALRIIHVAVFIVSRILLVCQLLLKYCILFF